MVDELETFYIDKCLAIKQTVYMKDENNQGILGNPTLKMIISIDNDGQEFTTEIPPYHR
jgi:hypothetical protein